MTDEIERDDELDEDDPDGDYLPQLEEPEEAPVEKTKTTKRTKQEPAAATSYGARELAALLKIDPKATRQALRQLAKNDDSPLLRVREKGGYDWTKRELESVAKKIAKAIEAE